MHAAAAARPAPSCADGPAMVDGPARDALRRAMQQLDDAEALAGPQRPPALCQALTEAARALAGLQAYAPAESYLAQALLWAGVMGSTGLRADLHCALAEVATEAADRVPSQGDGGLDSRRARERAHERARDHAFEAARLAGQAADAHCEVKLLLRASDVLDRCGDHDDAVLMQMRALVLMGLSHPELPPDAEPARQPAAGAVQLPAPGALM